MRTKNKEKTNPIKKIIIVAIFVAVICFIINTAPNYIKDILETKINVIINNNNITTSMKFEPYVGENDVVYLSTKDIANFFDEDIYFDNKYNQIITTSDTKVAVLPLDEKEMYVNSSKVEIAGAAIKKEESFYLPFSEMKDVFNLDINYIQETKTLVIDSLDRGQKKGNASKDISIKFKPTIFSKTIDKVNQGNSLVVIKELENGWIKVRTSNGKIGYTKDVANIYTVREDMENKKQVDGKVSIVWDYFYASAPDRTGTKIEGINVVSPSFVELVEGGKGDIKTKIGSSGQKYINWAHSNDYKVWMMVQNNGFPDTSSEILNDYKLREKLINNIINVVLQNDVDGVNLDFENVKVEDKDVLSRFIIELAPRLKEYGKVLSVDVTAPDGGGNWSECYNRNKIGKVADYVVFMAYDQHASYSKEAGTTAGADWIEVNLKKFIDREEVPKEKLVLAMPFYTRIWEEKSSGLNSTVIYMKSVDSNIPSGVSKTWDDDSKQNYVEYTKGSTTYKIWVEDEKSINAKFDLMDKYNLAGAAYWQKGFEPDSIWSTIKSRINK